MTIGELAVRLRSRYVPDHVVGEVLGRRWVDNIIPVALLAALTLYLIAAIPNFLSLGNLSDTSRIVCPTRSAEALPTTVARGGVISVKRSSASVRHRKRTAFCSRGGEGGSLASLGLGRMAARRSFKSCAGASRTVAASKGA